MPVPKGRAGASRQNATVVLTATAVEDALILPVTAVAGRLASGQVSRRDGDSFATVNVKLGASDGTSIIISTVSRKVTWCPRQLRISHRERNHEHTHPVGTSERRSPAARRRTPDDGGRCQRIVREGNVHRHHREIRIRQNQSRSIVGLLNNDYDGTLSYDGRDCAAWNDADRARFRCRHVGFVFQNYSLIPHLSAWENVHSHCNTGEASPAGHQKTSLAHAAHRRLGSRTVCSMPSRLVGRRTAARGHRPSAGGRSRSADLRRATGALDTETGDMVATYCSDMFVNSGSHSSSSRTTRSSPPDANAD